MSIRLSREKINYLSRKIMESLFSDEHIDFLDEPNEIRLSIVHSVEEELKTFERLERKAEKKIEAQKKSIKEGSREWEILFRKYYNDEVAKLGKFF